MVRRRRTVPPRLGLQRSSASAVSIAVSPREQDALFLALDQGGHASRALVYDRGARIVSEAHCELPLQRRGEHFEYDAQALLASVRDALAAAVAGLGARRRNLVAAGLATQRSNVVCWDRPTGAALSPVISWQDRRMRDWLRGLAAAEGRVRAVTGLPLSPHYGASKLRWCLDHLPAVAAAGERGRLAWGPMASFLLFHLLEERPLYADPVNAARTLLYDLAQGDWSEPMLELFGLPRPPLPDCVTTVHAYGTLRCGDLALPLTVCTGDQAAALFAWGAPRADTLYVTLGTGAFVQTPAGTARPRAERLLNGIAYRDRDRALYVMEGTVNGAGSALDWLALQHGGKDPIGALPEWLAGAGEPPLFLNGVAGLGTPYLHPGFPPRFVGRDDRCAAQAVAVIESIVFLLQANFEQLAAGGARPQRLLVGGGLARLDGLCRRLADLSGLPVERPAVFETTARGLACLLAGSTLQPEADLLDPRQAFGADAESQAATQVFTPDAGGGLHARYERWRTEMEQALQASQQHED